MSGFDFEKLKRGRMLKMRSMAGTEIFVFPDALEGEQRLVYLPGDWYKGPSEAPGRMMELAPNGVWQFATTREQIAADITETIRQLRDRGRGTVTEIRVATLQRLLTREEWDEAFEVVTNVDRRQVPNP